jgi:hypothetical protein
MKKATNEKQSAYVLVSISGNKDSELKRSSAIAAAYLNATQSQFLEHIAKAKHFFSTIPEAGVLAGPVARHQ